MAEALRLTKKTTTSREKEVTEKRENEGRKGGGEDGGGVGGDRQGAELAGNTPKKRGRKRKGDEEQEKEKEKMMSKVEERSGVEGKRINGGGKKAVPLVASPNEVTLKKPGRKRKSDVSESPHLSSLSVSSSPGSSSPSTERKPKGFYRNREELTGGGDARVASTEENPSSALSTSRLLPSHILSVSPKIEDLTPTRLNLPHKHNTRYNVNNMMMTPPTQPPIPPPTESVASKFLKMNGMLFKVSDTANYCLARC